MCCIYTMFSQSRCVWPPPPTKLAAMAQDILLIFCSSTVVSVLLAPCGVEAFSEGFSANKEGLKS